jgi:NADH-quinone oxidoreductase subunit L
MTLPLVVLAVLSVVGGFIELPHTLGDLPLFSDFLHAVLPAVAEGAAGVGSELALQVVAGVVSLGGIYLAYLLFLRRPAAVARWTAAWNRSRLGTGLQRFWFAGWGFDRLYDTLLVRPYTWLAEANRDDVIDLIFDGVAWLGAYAHRLLSMTQSGRVRWYAAGIAIGVVILVAMVVLL